MLRWCHYCQYFIDGRKEEYIRLSEDEADLRYAHRECHEQALRQQMKLATITIRQKQQACA